MTILSSLLEKIKTKRVEKFASVAEQYDSAVLALAKGEQVDADSLAEMLDSLDRSDSDLEADVEAKQRRIEARAELDRISELSKSLPPKRAKIAKLQEELAAFVAAKKPAIQALADEVKMLQLEVDRASYVENELMAIGIPLALQNRKDALVKRQRSLGEKQQRYSDMTDTARRNVDAAKVRLVDVEQRLSKSTVEYDRQLIQREIEGLKKRIEAYSGQITAWEPLRLEIEQEQASVNEESNEICRALMNP